MAKACWGEVVLTACHVLNRVPTKNSEINLYEGWKGKKQSLHYLRTWGYLAMVSVPINKKCKLGPKTSDCILLGYAHHITTYKFLVIKSDTPNILVDSLMESRDVTFFEKIFLMKETYSLPSVANEFIPEPTLEIESIENSLEDKEGDSELAPRRSKRPRIAKSFGEGFTVYIVEDTPIIIVEAYASPDAEYWKDVVHSEMDSITANGTWEAIDRPLGCKPVGYKWVSKKKLRPDGSIEMYNARLVAKGYTQKEGEDFFDTYSLVARLTTIRVLLSLVASHGLLVHQMDVKTAFLNGELEEEMYMDHPDGFIAQGQEGKVCLLIKSLYGLMQASKQRHKKFDRTLTSAGFAVNEADTCVLSLWWGQRSNPMLVCR
jgi:hypothetical protein